MNALKINPTKLKQQPNHKTDERDIKLLVDSLQKRGQILPIVVTSDHVVVRGRRLRDAAFRAGLIEVNVVVLDITYRDWVKGSYEHL